MSPGSEMPFSVSKTTSYRRGCVLYFFLYMAYGSIVPFMPLIWHSKGLSEHQVGLLGAMRPVGSWIVMPVLCSFADRHSIQQQMLYAALILYAVFSPSVLVAGGFSAVFAVETLSSVSKSPISSLVDSAVRHSFGVDGYGVQRLWGALGFGVASFMSGFLCDAAGGSYEFVMVFFVAVMAVTLLASTGVPVGRSVQLQDGHEGESRERLIKCRKVEDDCDARTASWNTGLVDMKRAGSADAPKANVVPNAAFSAVGTGDQVAGKVPFGPRRRFGQELPETSESKARKEDGRNVLDVLRVLLGTPQNVSFVLAVTISGIAGGIVDIFLVIRLEELGGSHLLFGLTRLVMCLSEVPCFYLSGPLIRHLGVRGVVALAQLCYLIRFIYYSVLRDPWWVLPAEAIHGLTFAVTWAATTDYAHEIAPDGMRATMQGVISGLYWGLGFGLGAVLGGFLYAGLGARLCFSVSAVLPLLSLLLLSLPMAQPWICNPVGLCGVWTETLRQRRRGGERAFELVATQTDNMDTEGFGGRDKERHGEIDASGNIYDGGEVAADV